MVGKDRTKEQVEKRVVQYDIQFFYIFQSVIGKAIQLDTDIYNDNTIQLTYPEIVKQFPNELSGITTYLQGALAKSLQSDNFSWLLCYYLCVPNNYP